MKKSLFLLILIASFSYGCASAEKTEEKNEVKNNVPHLQWSSRSPEKMDWHGALNYCKNVSDGGFKDWRLPNIDELRESIENCSKTEVGGECRVSGKNGCLSSECRNPKDSCACERKNKSVYSGFGHHQSFPIIRTVRGVWFFTARWSAATKKAENFMSDV